MADPIAPPLDSSAVNNIVATNPVPPPANGMGGGTPPPPPPDQATPAAPSAATSGMGGSAALPPRNFNSPQTTVSQPSTLSPEHQRLFAMGAGFDAVNQATDPAKSKPGSIWRTILSAALVGAAAGAGHGWKGMGEGAKAQEAVMDRQQKLKQQQVENDRQKKQDTLAQTKEAREKSEADKRNMYMDAQIATSQATTAHLRHEDDFHDQETHDARNKASQVLVNSFTDPKVGGRDPVDGAVPASLSATDLVKKYTENPKIRVPSDPNYVRHFIDTTDTTEATWSPATNNGTGGWVNETDGTPINLTDRTMFRVIDVPRDTMNTKVLTSGKDLNILMGLPGGKKVYDETDDKGNEKLYPVSPLDKVAIHKHGEDLRLEQSKVDVDKRKAAIAEAANTAEARRHGEVEYTNFHDTITETNRGIDNQIASESDPTKKAQLIADRKANDQTLLNKYNEIYPPKKGQPAPTTAPPPPADTTTSAGLLTTVKGYVSGDSKPVLEKYVKGAASYEQFVTNFVADQAKLPPELKAPLAEYQSIMSAGKSYYDNLPRVKRHTEKDDRVKKLVAIRAKHPNLNMPEDVSDSELDRWSDSGDYNPPVITRHGH